MVRDRAFYRSFFAMWTVLVLQNVITLSVSLADNMMLGGYSETALAGVAAVNQIQFVFQYLLLAIGEAAVILGSQYFGRRQTEPVRRLVKTALWSAASLSVLLFLLTSVFPRQLMLIFTTQEPVIAQGMEYLRVIRFTYLIFAVIQVLLAALRAVGTVRISLYLSLTALFVNCFWNYALIYGKFGLPSLGAKGAAIATLISRVTELIILLLFLRFRDRILNLKGADLLPRRKSVRSVSDLAGTYLRLMFPMMFVYSLWGFNSAAQNAILGHMSARALAANSAASTLFLLVKSTAQGSASTASYYTGKTIGEGDFDRLKLYVRTWQILFIGIGLLSGILLLFLRIPVLSVYRLESETRQMADAFLVILSVVTVTMSYQMPVNSGIIRGGGDIRYSTILDLVSIWCIVIPLSWLLAFVFHAAPAAVVWCLNADQIFKAVPGFFKCNYGHWAKKLTG